MSKRVGKGSGSVAVTDGRIVVSGYGASTCSFDAHGDGPLYGEFAVGDESVETPSGFRAVEEYALGPDDAAPKRIAWYTSYYQRRRWAWGWRSDTVPSYEKPIYVGDFTDQSDKLVYTGYCYGDLTWDGDLLYFNEGNWVCRIGPDLVVTRIFRHSKGPRRGPISLKVRGNRAVYIHWLSSGGHLMWYDLNTGELVEAGVCAYKCDFLDDDTIVISGRGSSVWLFDLVARKRKKVFTAKAEKEYRGFLDSMQHLDIATLKMGTIFDLLRFEYVRNFRLYLTTYLTPVARDNSMSRRDILVSCAIDGTDFRFEEDLGLTRT